MASRRFRTLALAAALLTVAASGHAATFSVTVDGTDAIFLAGRTDLVIPDATQPWPGPGDRLLRHDGPTPEELANPAAAKEQLPSFIPVAGGDIVRVIDPADGGINFFNGLGPPFFGPAGNGTATASNLNALGGISGYLGPQGALTGVFLSNDIPVSSPPAALPSTAPASIAPLLGQIFYIGDGLTGGGVLREFVAPAGATRLFFGIPDGFSFVGAPGYYDDNDGAYRIVVGVNEIPQIPEPSTYALLALGLASLAFIRRRHA